MKKILIALGLLATLALQSCVVRVGSGYGYNGGYYGGYSGYGHGHHYGHHHGHGHYR